MIGGNVEAIIQTNMGDGYNEIGQQVPLWQDTQRVKGFIDLSTGDSSHTAFNTKIQESTHVFISDYVALDASIEAENSRMVVNGKRYDILLIDDPMEMHQQLEIYLKYTGGQ